MELIDSRLKQFVLNFDLKYIEEEDSVVEAIDNWKHDCEKDFYPTEQAMVEGLKEDFENDWLYGTLRAAEFFAEGSVEEFAALDQFLPEKPVVKFHLRLTRTIEGMYKQAVSECEDSASQMEVDRSIEEKLDFVYCCEARKHMRKAVVEAELNLDYW